MIYHICPHFDLFIKTAINKFEGIKAGTNCCLELYNRVPSETRMRMSYTEGYTVYSFEISDPQWPKTLLKDCTGIFLHNLKTYMLDPILNLPESIPIYFRSYGSDIFDLIYDSDNNFYLPRTSEILNSVKPFQDKVIFTMNRVYYKMIPQRRKWEKARDKKLRLLKRTIAVSTTCPYEFEMLNKKLPDLGLTYLPFGYAPDNEEEYGESNIRRENILIGHSNSPGQNHADAFEFIKDFNIDGKIIVPLSYKKSKYTDEVIRQGYRYLGNTFLPLTSFLPKREYFDILSSCYAFIEFSLYQQGLANLVYFLKHGVNVYLPAENPVYLFFRDNGVTIFSVEHDLTVDHLMSRRISETEKKLNIEIIDKFFSVEIDKKTTEILVRKFI